MRLNKIFINHFKNIDKATISMDGKNVTVRGENRGTTAEELEMLRCSGISYVVNKDRTAEVVVVATSACKQKSR